MDCLADGRISRPLRHGNRTWFSLSTKMDPKGVPATSLRIVTGQTTPPNIRKNRALIRLIFGKLKGLKGNLR